MPYWVKTTPVVNASAICCVRCLAPPPLLGSTPIAYFSIPLCSPSSPVPFNAQCMFLSPAWRDGSPHCLGIWPPEHGEDASPVWSICGCRGQGEGRGGGGGGEQWVKWWQIREIRE